VYATVGVHPHDASTLMTPAPDCASALSSAVSTSLLSELRRLAADPHCVSLGECGLDYERMLSPRAAQLAAFEAQVSLAAELGRPLGAYRDAAAVLRRHYGTRLRPERVCVHCFTGSAADLAQLCEMGVRVGLTGYVSLTARAEATGTLAALRTAGLLPLDRVMLETDSPFMLPAKGLLTDGARALAAGRQNEPCALPAVCRAVALAMGLPAPDVAAQTTRTALDFFGLVEADSAIERLHSRGQSHVAKTQKH
jgi:TatD DNase family protein